MLILVALKEESDKIILITWTDESERVMKMNRPTLKLGRICGKLSLCYPRAI